MALSFTQENFGVSFEDKIVVGFLLLYFLIAKLLSLELIQGVRERVRVSVYGRECLCTAESVCVRQRASVYGRERLCTAESVCVRQRVSVYGRECLRKSECV